MKSKFIVFSLLVFSLTNAISQSFVKVLEATPASEIALKSTALMNEKLNLSIEQNDLVYAIYEKNWLIKKELISKGSFFSIRSDIKKQNEIQNLSFKDVLTKKQYFLYEEKVYEEIKSSIKKWLQHK